MEGLSTSLVVERRRLNFYKRYSNLVDEFYIVNEFKEGSKLLNSLGDEYILIPHGSLIEYLGVGEVMNLRIKIFGNRKLIEIESNQYDKMNFLKNAGIMIPQIFNNYTKIDKTVIVKLSGAKGGKGYFIAKNEEEVRKGLKKAIDLGLIKNTKEAIVQEYVFGVPMYFHYFYSPYYDRVELTGIDIRYETNVDGLKRIPDALDKPLPSFVVVGNIPVIARESLLPKIIEMGESLNKEAIRRTGKPITGPYCIETIIKDDGQIVAFEFSGRIVAGTNLYINGSPYTWLEWGEQMSVGRRIAKEIKLLGNDLVHYLD